MVGLCPQWCFRNLTSDAKAGSPVGKWPPPRPPVKWRDIGIA
jgi:hypothetical protein